MHHFDYQNGVLHAEDVPLPTIAEAVGTPAYVYSSATFERHYTVFCEAVKPYQDHVFYAVKANGNLGVLMTLARLDVSLIYRLDAAGWLVYHYPTGPVSTVGRDFSFR
jgi:diaminopimelate decarboxylase